VSPALRPARRRQPGWRCLIGGAALGLTLGLGLCSASGAQTGADAKAQPSTAALQAPLPVEVFFDWPDMSRPLLSPSGRYLAVLIKGTSQRNRLAVLDLAETKEAKVLASYEDADIADVHWVDDDWLVYSLHDSLLGSADRERIAPGLFSVARSGGKPRVLILLHPEIRFNPDPFGDSPRVDKRLNYNHFLLDVPQDDSHEIIVGEIVWPKDKDGLRVKPKRQNVQNGKVRNIDVGDAPPDINEWLFDKNGEPQLGSYEKNGRMKVFWREPGTKAWKQILDADDLNLPWTPASLGPNGQLYVSHPGGPNGTSVLARYDFEQRAPRAQATLETPGFDVTGPIITDPDSQEILGVRTLTDGEFTAWMNPALQAMQQEIDRRLPQRVNRISCRRCLADDRVVLVESWSDHDPGSYLLWHGKDQRLELIGKRRKAVPAGRMASLSFERISARDGRELPVWLTLPRQPSTEPRAAVVLVHGGPWVRGGSWHWDPLPQFLASRGWVVIEPEMRGSTGYGREHFRAGWRQWGEAMQDDVSDALAWAVREQGVDPQRVCIAGASYGGYATLMGLVRNPEQYRCGVALAAVSDLTLMLESRSWHLDDISANVSKLGSITLIGDPKADAAKINAASPLQQAARIKAPVLLIHGALDRRVPLEHAQNMRKALRRNGQEPEWLVFDDEGHGWNRIDNQRAMALKIESFLAQHLKK